METPTNFLFDNQVTPHELKQMAARLTSVIRALAGDNLESKMLRRVGETLSSPYFNEEDTLHVSWGASFNKTIFVAWLGEIRAAAKGKAAKKRGTKKCKKA